MTCQALPPELWIIVLDLAMEADVNPADQCTHWDFLKTSYGLRHFEKYISMFSSYHALRLVCRAFRDLLTSPLWLYMTKEHISGVMQVPLLVRAVYIPVWANSACNFHRIITSRTPYRIVSLDIQCDYITDSSGRRALSFDSLCRGSDKLTGIRYLALQPVLHGDGLDIEF